MMMMMVVVVVVVSMKTKIANVLQRVNLYGTGLLHLEGSLFSMAVSCILNVT
jgi:hypothetical protein